jgi:hypothetical protein
MFCEYGDDISGFIKAELFWHKKDPVTWNWFFHPVANVTRRNDLSERGGGGGDVQEVVVPAVRQFWCSMRWRDSAAVASFHIRPSFILSFPL